MLSNPALKGRPNLHQIRQVIAKALQAARINFFGIRGHFITSEQNLNDDVDF
jgi:hypothetical protein